MVTPTKTKSQVLAEMDEMIHFLGVQLRRYEHPNNEHKYTKLLADIVRLKEIRVYAEKELSEDCTTLEGKPLENPYEDH